MKFQVCTFHRNILNLYYKKTCFIINKISDNKIKFEAYKLMKFIVPSIPFYEIQNQNGGCFIFITTDFTLYTAKKNIKYIVLNVLHITKF